MFGLIAQAIGGAVKGYFTHKAEKTKAKREVEIARIKGVTDWEQTMAQASSTSWKDEWFTVIISVPFIMVFYAVVAGDTNLLDRVQEAFLVMKNDIPEQYWVLLIIAFSASFGIKPAVKGIANLLPGGKK